MLFDCEERREGAVVVSATATDEQVRLSIRPACPAQIQQGNGIPGSNASLVTTGTC